MKTINEQLCTVGCQESGSSCCKKGFIFIPEEEYSAILAHLHNIQANDSILEFQSRCKKESGYYLYDQKDRCQFLDSNELCKLHTEGVKPSECFWWPLHVYLPEDSGNQKLVVKVANCCSGCQKICNKDVQDLKERAAQIGKERLIDFRTKHTYGESYKIIDEIF